ncbi:MAG: glutamate mutase L, partial [Tissierellales bacterium]|nr:glutamate mutase L [Tissierellales bacterium]
PNGMVFYQEGKDLQNLSSIIGTGGVLVNSENPRSILEVGLYKDEEPDSLKPKNPKCLLDKKYILSAMGLLSMIDEDKAVRILKKYVVEV